MLGLLVAGASACTPASGVTDARQFDLGSCGQFEVRVGGQSGGLAFVAARQFGLEPPFVADPPARCFITSLTLGIGPDSSHVTSTICFVSGAPPICDAYSGGVVGGVWQQLAIGGIQPGELQSATVRLLDGRDAVHVINAYP